MDLLSFALILLAFWIAIAIVVATALACAAGRADETKERWTHEARARRADRRETALLDPADRKALDVLADELTRWGAAAANVNFAERRVGGRDVATSHFKSRSRISQRPQRITKLLH